MSEPQNNSIYRVTGGVPLSGEITPQGNKNEALPLLAAACLTDEALTLENLPGIEDVTVMTEILRSLGVGVESAGQAAVTVRAQSEPKNELPSALCVKLRGSVTLAGPLLARTGRVLLPKPGGDRIGRRRLDTHVMALQALGAEVDVRADGIELRARELKGADILLDEASVTATENAICAASLAKGETILRNAACEPHVQGLCRMLSEMGARIEGTGSNVLKIQGVERLHGTRHRIAPDYLEVGSFISLAAVTGGELLVKDVNHEDLRMILHVYGKLGIRTVARGKDLLVPRGQSLEIANDLGEAVPTIDDAPWPAFPADMTSVALITATQCKGTVLMHEKMYESRLFFVDSLIAMGARIILCDPHRAVVIGPAKLHGSRLSTPDIRAGITMLIAALCAEGRSVIQNIGQIDRGFERIDERLRKLGARIERAAPN
ncbi:MAG TPA: UDP-N-acetylglucosamine 1-carboxyvinyltransferase [Verrucomicrobiae bacterium]|jgi:UDP-N-acetylglucosamine 1-carboxyvinyltransferase|nr:UDP-N-acetylglucosamine 1-carboxyvinyltransferase [Verrucomicrobiae bacterium]